MSTKFRRAMALICAFSTVITSVPSGTVYAKGNNDISIPADTGISISKDTSSSNDITVPSEAPAPQTEAPARRIITIFIR